jgi:hypothetical protein
VWLRMRGEELVFWWVPMLQFMIWRGVTYRDLWFRVYEIWGRSFLIADLKGRSFKSSMRDFSMTVDLETLKLLLHKRVVE